MKYRKIKLKIKDKTDILQRIIQIFARRRYYLDSIRVRSKGDMKEVILEFPADFYIYKTIVDQLKKLIDLVEIEHDEINYEHKELIQSVNLY